MRAFLFWAVIVAGLAGPFVAIAYVAFHPEELHALMGEPTQCRCP